MKIIHVSRQSVHQHVIEARTRKHVPVQKPFITVLTHSGFSFSNVVPPVKVCWKLLETGPVEPHIVRRAAVKCGLHAGNMKLNSHQDEQVLLTVLYCMCNKYNLMRNHQIKNSVLNPVYDFPILKRFSGIE